MLLFKRPKDVAIDDPIDDPAVLNLGTTNPLTAFVGVLALAPLVLAEAWFLRNVWNWFVIDYFGLKPIGWLTMIALSTVIGFATSQFGTVRLSDLAETKTEQKKIIFVQMFSWICTLLGFHAVFWLMHVFWG